MNAWQLSVPATIANLGPGFDRLGMALNLRLHLQAKPHSEFQLSLSGYGSDIFPTDASNLMVRAYEHACRANEREPIPLALEIHNPIPIRSGMGSSAAAIVIAVALAREVHQMPWERQQMLREAVEIEGHPDNVAPALLGGLICCDHEGDQVQANRQLLAHSIHVITAKPPEQALTKLMREILPNPQPQALLASHQIMVQKLLQALAGADPEGLKISSLDQLHQPYRLASLPQAKALFEIFNQDPKLNGAFLCGSGPTVGAWVIGPKDPTQQLARQLQDHQITADLRFLRPDQDGVRREGTQNF